MDIDLLGLIGRYVERDTAQGDEESLSRSIPCNRHNASLAYIGPRHAFLLIMHTHAEMVTKIVHDRKGATERDVKLHRETIYMSTIRL